MILQIKTHNYNMIKGSVPIALIFKISYKAMISAFSTQHKFQSKRDETFLLQTDLSKANTVIPKPIQWKDVNLPEEWILEGAAPPAIPKQLEPNTELQNVTQYSDVINLPFQSVKSQPRFSTSDIPSTSIRSVDYTTSVPHPVYTSSQRGQRQEEKEPSPPTSPTFSAVTENVINAIGKDFELDKNLLHNDFYSENNKEKRFWFFKHFLNQRKEIQQTYYEFVNLHQVHILFFDWFEIYSSDNNLPYPFKESNHITIRKKIPEWKLFDCDRTIESEHPPLRSLTVDHGEPPVQIRASPYKIPKPNDSCANLSSIIQQNNFCNTNLNTIGKQLTRIENQFQTSTIVVSTDPSKSDSDKKLKEHIFKPFQVSKTSQKLIQESKSDFAKAIREQLDRIETASSSSSKRISSKQIMPPRKKDKGKAVLKDTESQATSKEPQSTPSKEKLFSSAMPIKSWIEMVEEQEAQYKTITFDDQSKFDEQTKLTDTLIRNWLCSKGFLQPTITGSKAQQTFLTQKSKVQSLLASAKTEGEYFKVMEQLLTSRSKSSVADSSEDEEPFISLGYENEDDCFGIFSPIKYCK
ncbi:hypothetical protein KPL71_023981 [Citrus sinensis]|uniref:Uncharacterized protein n=1 Tax=Citrus sinensis TaxID=2711 RepID=A0ACB8IMK6_CITSI|nr:hypothetical protein KPL71_023981 [Citrus sinensis]